MEFRIASKPDILPSFVELDKNNCFVSRSYIPDSATNNLIAVADGKVAIGVLKSEFGGLVPYQVNIRHLQGSLKSVGDIYAYFEFPDVAYLQELLKELNES